MRTTGNKGTSTMNCLTKPRRRRGSGTQALYLVIPCDWEYVYEDTVRVARLMGIFHRPSTCSRLMAGAQDTNPTSASGFYSQGMGPRSWVPHAPAAQACESLRATGLGVAPDRKACRTSSASSSTSWLPRSRPEGAATAPACM